MYNSDVLTSFDGLCSGFFFSWAQFSLPLLFLSLSLMYCMLHFREVKSEKQKVPQLI